MIPTGAGRSSNADLQVGGDRAAIPTHGAADATSTRGLNAAWDAEMNGRKVAVNIESRQQDSPDLLPDASPAPVTARANHSLSRQVQLLLENMGLRGLRDLVRPREHQPQDDLDALESGMIDSTANPSTTGAHMILGGLVISLLQILDLLEDGDVAANVTAAGGRFRAPGRPVPGATANGPANISGLGPRFVLENPGRGGTTNIEVFHPNGSGALVRISITRDRRRRNVLPNNLTKITLVFFAQLAAAFLARVLSGSTDNWSAITLLLASLIGFILTLISISEIINSASISSVISKVSFATVVYAVIISIVVALPIHAKTKIVATVLASLPALVAIARAPA